jgi:hypothetical protein
MAHRPLARRSVGRAPARPDDCDRIDAGATPMIFAVSMTSVLHVGLLTIGFRAAIALVTRR